VKRLVNANSGMMKYYIKLAEANWAGEALKQILTIMNMTSTYCDGVDMYSDDAGDVSYQGDLSLFKQDFYSILDRAQVGAKYREPDNDADAQYYYIPQDEYGNPDNVEFVFFITQITDPDIAFTLTKDSNSFSVTAETNYL
jgi:hypothetical protein